MNLNLKITFAFLATSILLFFSYFTLRTTKLQLDYVNHNLALQTKKIVKNYTKLKAKDKNLSKKSLSSFSTQKIKKYKNIALILISNDKRNIKLSIKNDKYINSAKLYDLILNDFSLGKFKKQGLKEYNIEHYIINRNSTPPKQIKFYTFEKNVNDDKILIVYPFIFTKKTVTKIILESTLILLLLIIIFSIIYIKKQKKNKPKTELTQDKRDINKTIIRENKTNEITSTSSQSSTETLNKFVFNLFKKIHYDYNSKTISLFIKNTSDIFSKSYELKEKSFLRIDSKGFDVMDINTNNGDLLKNGKAIQNNKEILIPIIFNELLISTIKIERDTEFSEIEIEKLIIDSSTVGEAINEFLILNNIMIDNDTKLFSQTYFKIKYDEIINEYKENKKELSIIYISILNKTKTIDSESISTIIKLTSQTIADNIDKINYIFRIDNNITILLPETSFLESMKFSEKIFSVLTKLKIKISKNNPYKIFPNIGLSSLSELNENEDLSSAATSNLETAQKRDTPNIQG